jgi:thiamine biosynthesis lipoprotein
MNAIGLAPRAGRAWSRVGSASSEIAVADRDALGTTARIVVWPARNLLRLLAVVDRELDMLDRQASRFRSDSEVSRLYSSGAGSYVISDGLAEAVGIALAAARWTEGRSDPTVGTSLISLGYDRDFTRIEPGTLAPPSAPDRPRGWQAVRLDANVLTVPDRLMLDLGATAKGLGADRAARAAYAAAGGGGILISLGGDMAVAGRAPAGGWPVLVADEHRQTRAARNIAASVQHAGQSGPAVIARPPREADPAVAQQIRLSRGGLATSSVTSRRWLRGRAALHHIIDPRTGMPASGPWRTVSVVAASCAEANAASTAAIVAGDEAFDWLSAQGLPAKLIGHDGLVRRTGGWPERDDGRVEPPESRLNLYLNRRTQ